MLSCLLHLFCGFIIAYGMGFFLKRIESYHRLEKAVEIGDGFELLPRSHDVMMGVDLGDFSFGVDGFQGEIARAVEV